MGARITVVSTSYFNFSFPGAKKGLPEGSLWEIAISLNCGLNSARKFQSGVSTLRPLIPARRSQNMRGAEFRGAREFMFHVTKTGGEASEF